MDVIFLDKNIYSKLKLMQLHFFSNIADAHWILFTQTEISQVLWRLQFPPVCCFMCVLLLWVWSRTILLNYLLCVHCIYLCWKMVVYPKGLTLPTQLCFLCSGPEDLWLSLHLNIRAVYEQGDSSSSLTSKMYFHMLPLILSGSPDYISSSRPIKMKFKRLAVCV